MPSSHPSSTITHPRPLGRGIVLTLLCVGVLGPFLVALGVMEHWFDLSLPSTKLAILGVQYVVLLPLLLIVLLRSRQTSVGDEQPTRGRWLLAGGLFALLLFPLAAYLGLGRYQGDESAYLFEARCLNAGSLSAPRPEGLPRKALEYAHHLQIGDRWSGKYAPGWPIVLAAFTAVRTEWIANPVLGLLLIFLTYRIAKETFGPDQAMLATLILGTSAFFLLNCLGYMSHVCAAVLAAVAVLCYLRMIDDDRAKELSITGFYASIIAMMFVRPFTALCIGGALLICWQFRPKPKALVGLVGYGALLGILTAAALATQNYLLTGNPKRSAYAVYGGGQTRELSFAPADLWQSITDVLPRRLIDTESMNFPFVTVLALWAFWSYRKNRAAWGIMVTYFALVAGYVLELDNSDSPIGERFYFEGAFALAILAGAGLHALYQQMRVSSLGRTAVTTGLVTASFCTVAICTDWQLGLRRPSRDMAIAFHHPPFSEGVVFIRGTDIFPAFNWNFNDPKSKILEVIDPGPDIREEWARILKAQHWATLTYNPVREKPEWKEGE